MNIAAYLVKINFTCNHTLKISKENWTKKIKHMQQEMYKIIVIFTIGERQKE